MQHDCHCNTHSGGSCSCEQYIEEMLEKGKNGTDPLTGLPFPPPPQQASWPFSFTAGLAVRRSAKRHVMDAAHEFGVHLEIEEDKGWFSTGYYFTVSGDLDRVTAFREAAIEWCEAVSK